jgi:flap endonuclease-1
LVYEAPLLRNITSRRDPLTLISGSEVRTVLSLDRANYLDFVLLLGTDFSQRIKNIGPHRALKFIREYGSIERIVEQETQYPPRLPISNYLEQIDAARLVFRTLPPVPDRVLFEQKEMDTNLVSELLQRYRLHKLVANDTSYTSNLLGSNYFGDNP